MNPITYSRLLLDISDGLMQDAGLTATVEFPGCIVIPHRVLAGKSWWFGTSNETWMGDLIDESGDYQDLTLDTRVPSSETDADRIASAIAQVLS